ncbi:MAG TPA: hypothetical protein VFK56_16750, partial [Mycobacterium sp.]|nr:hypothetical protein [Mycobacterium sp.]
ARVTVDSLDDAVRHLTVAARTIGGYPYARKAQLRDRQRHAQGLSGSASSTGWPTTTSTSRAFLSA